MLDDDFARPELGFEGLPVPTVAPARPVEGYSLDAIDFVPMEDTVLSEVGAPMLNVDAGAAELP